MPKTDEKLKKLDEQIARRKAALKKRLSPPEGAGADALTERELRKLLKQAQRRRRRLVLDRKRHATSAREARDEGEKEKGAEQ